MGDSVLWQLIGAEIATYLVKFGYLGYRAYMHYKKSGHPNFVSYFNASGASLRREPYLEARAIELYEKDPEFRSVVRKSATTSCVYVGSLLLPTPVDLIGMASSLLISRGAVKLSRKHPEWSERI